MLLGGFFMKIKIRLILVMLCVVTLLGCSKSPEEKEQNSVEVLSGSILKTTDTSILVYSKDNASSDLLFVDINGIAIYDEDGKEIGIESLSTGKEVEIGYDGTIMETYPAQLGKPDYIKIKTSTQGSPVVMYYDVIKQLYEEDPGLNTDITTIALDLENAQSMSEMDKNALIYLLTCEYPLEVRLATIKQLEEEGKIKDLYYEEGIVIQMKDQGIDKDSIDFSINKWRSGLGAIGFDDCSATFKDGIWNIELNGAWIS